MKSFAYWINGAAVLGIAGMMAMGSGIADPGIDTMTTASIAPPADADRFMVVDHARNRTCIVALHRAAGYDIHRLEPGKCDGMPPALSEARIWQDTATGRVRITDRKGNVVMRLSADDRFGWNVVEPADLALSFEAF
ncbi:hypothetical protein [Oricola thermophila]|uniref:Alkaline proteinase inhibitor/ Outer membrane lipoprotein Omp19 domain-containing protein n=1 Tax=Oricola thermophila TaxID=2742145 RepID=A0A6N1VHT6_9HYPH|nr:hypothetical protein [Oricola thermophila]QKV20314.1 hypothetical protein HTY61_18590 [Oricola thermophila]